MLFFIIQGYNINKRGYGKYISKSSEVCIHGKLELFDEYFFEGEDAQKPCINVLLAQKH